MKNASFEEISEFYDKLKNIEDADEAPTFPGEISEQTLADLYLYYGDTDLDILSNREYFVNQKPDFETFSLFIESDIFKKLSSKEEASISYYEDDEIKCDKGIHTLVESFCILGLETLESCSGLHLEEISELSIEDKYKYFINENNPIWIYPHLSFVIPDELAEVFYNKLFSKIRNTGGVFRASFDKGEVLLELEDFASNGARWSNLLKAVYFWRCLELLMTELLGELNIQVQE